MNRQSFKKFYNQFKSSFNHDTATLVIKDYVRDFTNDRKVSRYNNVLTQAVKDKLELIDCLVQRKNMPEMVQVLADKEFNGNHNQARQSIIKQTRLEMYGLSLFVIFLQSKGYNNARIRLS